MGNSELGFKSWEHDRQKCWIFQQAKFDPSPGENWFQGWFLHKTSGIVQGKSIVSCRISIIIIITIIIIIIIISISIITMSVSIIYIPVYIYTIAISIFPLSHPKKNLKHEAEFPGHFGSEHWRTSAACPAWPSRDFLIQWYRKIWVYMMYII